MKKLTHLAPLDGLRGLAVCLVMICHFSAPFQGSVPYEKLVYYLVETGWVGVDLFFVLSGFLISAILLDSKLDSKPVLNFYRRRFLRIFPLYYVCLTVLFVLLPLWVNLPADFLWVKNQQLWLWSYLSNVLVFKEQVALPYINHFWSLAVEEQFYLFWPWAVIYLSAPAFRKLCSFAIILALSSRVALHLSGVVDTTIPYLTLCRMDAFALGGWVAIGFKSQQLSLVASRLKFFTVGAVVLFLASFVLEHEIAGIQIIHHLGNRTVLALVFAWTLTHILSRIEAKRSLFFLDFRPLQLLGKYCYGLYLLHPAVLILATTLVSTAALERRLGSVAAMLLINASLIPLSFFAAFISWHLLEKHFLKLSPSRSGESKVRYFETNEVTVDSERMTGT